MLNVPPNRNFGDAIAVQDLKVIHKMKLKHIKSNEHEIFSMFPPRTKILEPPLHTVYTRGINRAEISGPARKIFFSARPSPQSMYYKICTVQFF